MPLVRGHWPLASGIFSVMLRGPGWGQDSEHLLGPSAHVIGTWLFPGREEPVQPVGT